MRPHDWERPRKYSLLAHAERRVLAKAAKLGLGTEGKALICTWAACSDCAIQIVESGIATLVRHYPPRDDATERWLESVSIGDEILKAGGVEIMDILGPIDGAPKILRSGEIYDPAS
jgi:dCMP deaminase